MNILDYLGKFHPLVVHLPIGILSLFIVLTVFVSRSQLRNSESIIRLVLFTSALTATASSISGLLIANSGGYDNNLVTGHQVMGIILTLLNWALWYKLEFLFKCKVVLYRLTIGFTFVLMTLTGHAGGSLTHGSDFLTPPPLSVWFSSESIHQKRITLESSTYDAVSEIFQVKCMSCHGRNKQKGELRLDGKEYILIGGENGKLIADNAASSLLIERLLLPLDDEDHMPPKEKKQLSKTEIDFLTWWIDNGSNFENTLSEMNMPDSLRGILTTEEKVIKNPLVPDQEVPTADQTVVDKLKSLNLIVIPVAFGSNYLFASFTNVIPENTNAVVRELAKIKDQLIWLNLDYQNLDQESWDEIGKLSNLRKLSVRNSNLDDNGISTLKALINLVHLNLVGTDIAVEGIVLIEGLKNLKSLYLFQTSVESDELTKVQKIFPETSIEFGNYVIPVLKSDTVVLTKEDL